MLSLLLKARAAAVFENLPAAKEDVTSVPVLFKAQSAAIIASPTSSEHVSTFSATQLQEAPSTVQHNAAAQVAVLGSYFITGTEKQLE